MLPVDIIVCKLMSLELVDFFYEPLYYYICVYVTLGLEESAIKCFHYLPTYVSDVLLIKLFLNRLGHLIGFVNITESFY